MKRLVIDVDNTITRGDTNDYNNPSVGPNEQVCEKLRQFRSDGFEIILYTSRNMRTYQNNVGKINAHTLPKLIAWLDHHKVPYDEIWTGKPWCGTEGFYVDDKAIRPDEFVTLEYEEIYTLIGKSHTNNQT